MFKLVLNAKEDLQKLQANADDLALEIIGEGSANLYRFNFGTWSEAELSSSSEQDWNHEIITFKFKEGVEVCVSSSCIICYRGLL